MEADSIANKWSQRRTRSTAPGEMGICVIGRVAADEYSDAPGISIHRHVGHCKRISYRDCRFDFEWSYLFVQSIVAYIPNVLAALLVLLVGNVIARFIARSVQIGAVN